MASIEKRQTTRGVRYDVRYREPGGRPRTKTFRRRADAERFARSVEVDKDRGLFVDPGLSRLPLADVAARWLESNPAKRAGSWARDEQIVRGHIVPEVGARPIGSLSLADVQTLVNRWARDRAPRTVVRQFGVLRAICNYAVASEMIGRSPCRNVKLPETKPLGKRHVVTADELARLAQALGGVGGLGPMVYLGAASGLRWGEVAGLRVGHLDLDGLALTIAETVVRGRRGAVEVGAPKSDAGRRVLPAPVGLMKMLSEHIAARGLAVSDATALLFTSPDGQLLRYSNWLRRSWHPAAVAAGLGRMVPAPETGKERYEGLGFHDLRRANATGLVAARVDMKTAQVLLGHSDPRLTIGLYAQVVPELGAAAADAMAARFLEPSREERAMEADEQDSTTTVEPGDSTATRNDERRPR